MLARIAENSKDWPINGHLPIHGSWTAEFPNAVFTMLFNFEIHIQI